VVTPPFNLVWFSILFTDKLLRNFEFFFDQEILSIFCLNFAVQFLIILFFFIFLNFSRAIVTCVGWWPNPLTSRRLTFTPALVCPSTRWATGSARRAKPGPSELSSCGA
jgi:hypothetical protein